MINLKAIIEHSKVWNDNPVLLKCLLSLLANEDQDGEVMVFYSDIATSLNCHNLREASKILDRLQDLKEIEFKDYSPVRYPCGRWKDSLATIKISNHKIYRTND